MSMSFYAGIREGNNTRWAFKPEEMQKGTFSQELADKGEYPYVDNPSYRADLNFDVNNRNMRLVIEALGFTIEDSSFDTEIDRFIGVATSWLQQHVGKPSMGFSSTEGRHVVPASVQRDGNVLRVVPVQKGPQMIEGGLRDGYINEAIARMVFIAQEGKRRGANVVYAA